jgi:probable rRNA maturation factor
MHPTIDVEISDTQNHLRVEPAALGNLVRVVLGSLDRTHASISIALVDNAAIHVVNRTHLGHDWPTDVVSFPLGEPGDLVLSGELVVSAEMACESANDLGVEPHDELALYVVHGLLHLCGFDDRDDIGRQRMRQHEEKLMSLAGLTNPFAGFRPPGVEPPASHESQPPAGLPDQQEAEPGLVTHQREDWPWTA